MRFDFTDRVVLVTGGTSGIGLSITQSFLAAGARVMLNSHRTPDVERALATLGAVGGNAVGFAADVRDRAAVDTMFDAVVTRWGRIDILVNNAGIYPSVPVAEMTEEQWDAVLDTNLKGPFLTSKTAARLMMARGAGKIVNVSSGSWRIAREGSAAYCASKAGLVMLTAVLAQELGRHKINVNAVAPGLIDVQWPEVSPHTRAYHEATVGQIPWGRMGTPAQVADAVLMLCTPQADYVTGAVLSVDGGLSLGRYGIPMSG